VATSRVEASWQQGDVYNTLSSSRVHPLPDVPPLWMPSNIRRDRWKPCARCDYFLDSRVLCTPAAHDRNNRNILIHTNIIDDMRTFDVAPQSKLGQLWRANQANQLDADRHTKKYTEGNYLPDRGKLNTTTKPTVSMDKGVARDRIWPDGTR